MPGFTYNTAESTEYNFRQLLIFLHEIDGNNLLIIDNANNLQNLLNVKRNIETLRWKVIITSRTEPPGYNNIPVDKLDKKDAKILFDRYYKRDYKDELLDKLLEKIEYHTLLTELLAKAANENPELDLPKLCEILDSKDLSADELQMDIVTKHELDKKNRLKMIQLYKYINKIFDATVSKLSNEEKQYLRYFAVLPSQFIEFTDLLDYFQIIKKDKTRFGNTLNLLYRKGWLIREKNTYKAHSLIQTIAREKLKPDIKNCDVLINSFIRKSYTEAGDNPLNKKEFVTYAESLLKTIKTENNKIATLSNNLSTIFRNFGDYEKALVYNLKSITIREQVLESNHPDLATSYNNISLIYSDLGDYEKALKYRFKALDIEEKVLDENHPQLAGSYNNTSSIYLDLGDYEKALEYNLKAIAIIEKVLEPNHPDFATSYNNIAAIYSALGDYEKALEYNLKSIAICEKVFKPNHPDFATSYNNIAATYSSLGNYEKALEYNLRSITIREKILEPKHPDLATSYLNIAVTYYYLKIYKKAKYYINKAVKIYKKFLPKDRPELKSALSRLEKIYKAMGE